MDFTPSPEIPDVPSSDQPEAVPPQPDQTPDRVWQQLRSQVEMCKEYRRRLITNWQTSVDYRRGKPFPTQADHDRVSVPIDWSLTKEKESLLFSQVPAVRISHPPQTTSQEAGQWLPAFERKVNDTAIAAGIEAAMGEVLPDCINAAGFGAVLVSRDVITETVELPVMDLAILPPDVQAHVLATGVLPGGLPVPTAPTPRVADSIYTITRISPADLLWPIAFTGSDFNRAPWIGRSGRISWAEAVQRFGLREEDKRKVIGDTRSSQDRIDRIVAEAGRTAEPYDETVSFDEIFYYDHVYNPQATSFHAIHHVVFVHGLRDPVIDGPWAGQRVDEESGLIVGSLKRPIQVLTLTYVTDSPIPPSDSEMARPQVDELNDARTTQVIHRKRNIPIDWYNTDRLDPTIQYQLMRGTHKGMIPVQGDGSGVIGTVQRAALPAENMMFDRIIKGDIQDTWQLGTGVFGGSIETSGEAAALMSTRQVRVAHERAKVSKFFLNIMEVLGGLIAIFEEPSSFGPGFTPLVSRTLGFSILADSAVLLDSNQRMERLIRFINFFGKTGWVDIESVVREAATLSGLDPSVVVRPPQPRPPAEPNISLRLTGTEDLLNPLILGMLIKSGQGPTPELIEQAKRLIEISVTPPAAPALQMPAGAENLPPGLQQALVDGLNSQAALPEGPPSPDAAPPPPATGEAFPDWTLMPRINQRSYSTESNE